MRLVAERPRLAHLAPPPCSLQLSNPLSSDPNSLRVEPPASTPFCQCAQGYCPAVLDLLIAGETDEPDDPTILPYWAKCNPLPEFSPDIPSLRNASALIEGPDNPRGFVRCTPTEGERKCTESQAVRAVERWYVGTPRARAATRLSRPADGSTPCQVRFRTVWRHAVLSAAALLLQTRGTRRRIEGRQRREALRRVPRLQRPTG